MFIAGYWLAILAAGEALLLHFILFYIVKELMINLATILNLIL